MGANYLKRCTQNCTQLQQTRMPQLALGDSKWRKDMLMEYQFIHDVTDWQLKSVDSAFDILYCNIPSSEDPKCMRWILHSDDKLH